MKRFPSAGGRPAGRARLTAGRRGTVLVQVALFLTVWAALAALSIDIARVRSAREAMQNAVDHAAVEGLRQRDALGEAARREAAARAVRLAFDADLIEGALEPDPPLGAGAIVPVSGLNGVPGAGGLNPGGIRFWKPRPEPNLVNAAYGDFVAGEFTPGLGAGFETPQYLRNDFTAATAAESPTSSAFLARLRRTRPDQPLDRLAGVSTAGPTISLLFGFGAAVGPNPDTGFDVKRDGVTARATSIARASRALAAALGPPGVGLLEAGRGPDLALVPALDFDVLQALPVGSTLAFEADDAGVVRRSPDGDPIGRLWGTLDGLAVADASAPADLPRPGALGIELSGADGVASGTGVRALPVQRLAPDGRLELVGFAAVQVSAVDTLWTVTRLADTMAATRASARIPSAWLALEPGGPLESPGLAASHFALQGALLAPVLAR